MKAPFSLAQLTTPKVKGIVYGSTGVGKTVFACSSQQYRTFLFDVEEGAFSALKWRGNQTFPGVKCELVDVWTVRSKQDFVEGMQYLIANQQKYGVVVIDTATELQRIIIQELCDAAKIAVASQREWGIALTVMELFARQSRNLPMHVLWMAHEVEREDEQTKKVMFRPSFQGQFGKVYGKHFSLIARFVMVDQHLKTEDGQAPQVVTHRYLNCQRDENTDAKDRSTALKKWELPILDSILDRMTEKLPPQPQPQAAPKQPVAAA